MNLLSNNILFCLVVLFSVWCLSADLVCVLKVTSLWSGGVYFRQTIFSNTFPRSAYHKYHNIVLMPHNSWSQKYSFTFSMKLCVAWPDRRRVIVIIIMFCVISNIDVYNTTIGNQSTKITLTCDKTLYWFIGPFWFSLLDNKQ